MPSTGTTSKIGLVGEQVAVAVRNVIPPTLVMMVQESERVVADVGRNMDTMREERVSVVILHGNGGSFIVVDL